MFRRKTKFLRPEWVRRILIFGRTTSLWITSAGKGIRRPIGEAGSFRFDPAFHPWRYERYGRDSSANNGFKITLDRSRGKSVIFDVGAHIGLVSLSVSRVVDANATIIAFEPSAINVKYLRRHLRLNSVTNVRVVSAVIGCCDSESVTFFEAARPDSMGRIIGPPERNVEYQAVERPQICLDDYSKSKNLVPDLIKIDVEGAEYEVLSGAVHILRSHRPVVMLSVHPEYMEMMGDSVDDLRELMADVNYTIRDTSGSIPTEFHKQEYVLEPVI